MGKQRKTMCDTVGWNWMPGDKEKEEGITEKTKDDFNATEHPLPTIDDVETIDSIIGPLHSSSNDDEDVHASNIHYKEVTDEWFRSKIKQRLDGVACRHSSSSGSGSGSNDTAK